LFHFVQFENLRRFLCFAQQGFAFWRDFLIRASLFYQRDSILRNSAQFFVWDAPPSYRSSRSALTPRPASRRSISERASVMFHSIKKTPFYADYIATAIEIRVEMAFFLHYALCSKIKKLRY